MKNAKNKIVIGILAFMLIAWMIKGTFDQSGIENLKGGFKEVASYRNDNNTGPIQRIYAVVVNDTATAQLQEYGNLMPHTKYGNTKVYYFMAGKGVPTKLFPGDTNFDAQFNESCFALYEKSAMGNTGLVKWPLR